jgi:hypothetical protein
MVPHAAPLQPAPPITFQVTAVLAVPVIVTANCCVLPSATVALFGLNFIAMWPAEFVGLLMAFVKPAHPEGMKLPNRTTKRSSNNS